MSGNPKVHDDWSIPVTIPPSVDWRDPVDRIVEALTAAGCEPRRTAQGWEARCPSHRGERHNLSISTGDDGRALVHCHHASGCSAEAIVRSLGLEPKDLYPSTTRRPARKKKVAKIWDTLDQVVDYWRTRPENADARAWTYRSAGGEPLMAVVRIDPRKGRKRYTPYHREGAGWQAGDPAGSLPLYRLDELPAEGRIVLVEGEKAADAARAVGVPAVTSAHGAEAVGKSDWSPLAGRDVVVVPDNDEAGETYASAACAALSTLSPPATPRIVHLPGLSQKGDDIVEWVEIKRSEGRDDATIRAELQALADAAEAWRGAVPGGFAGFVGTSPQEYPEFGGPPRPITTELLSVPRLDPEMLPRPFRTWILDIAERGSFPVEYPAAAAVTAVSGLMGRRVAMKPKRRDDWLVSPNLWGAAVGPAGVFKTPAVEEGMRPLHRLEAEARERHGAAIKAHNEALMVSEVRVKALKSDMEKKAKAKADVSELAGIAAQIGGMVQDQDPPTPKRYLINDATVEKLGELLAENPNGLTVFRDELVGFLRSMEKQGRESDRQFYLESWNGLGSFSYDRIGRGTVFIPSVTTSLFGCIQPGPLARYIRGSIAGDGADGFMTRFQVLVYPDPPETFVNVDRYPDGPAKNRAFAVFRGIEAFDPIARGCEVHPDRNVPYASFDDEAQAFFDGWRTDLENRLRSGRDNDLVVSHLSKFRKLMPALSLIFHVVERIDEPRLGPVPIEAAMRAAAWCDFLEAHARRAYQSALDGDPEAAMQLAERIKQSLPNPFTFRQVAQKGWSGLATVDDVRKAVDVLEDRGWVRVVESRNPNGGRPSEQVWINPCISSLSEDA